MKTIALGPYTNEMYGFATAIGNLQEYCLAAIVSPKGTGLGGTTLKLDCGANVQEIKIDNEISVCNVDIFVILPYDFDQRYEKRFTEQLMMQMQNISTVICLAALSEDSILALETRANVCGCCWICDTFTNEKKVMGDVEKQYVPQYIDVPIIAVATVYDEFECTNIALQLFGGLTRIGYKILFINTSPISTLVGGKMYPKVFTNKHYGDREQINELNRFLREECRKEMYDIILLSVPGLLQRLSDEYPVGYGTELFKISQAVQIDHMILCMPYVDGGVELFKEMEKICQYRFGVEYCAFHMSDKFLSPEEIVRHMKIVSHPIEEKTMLTTLHALRELGVTVWNIEKLGDDTVIDNILSNLQNKPDTMET